MRSRTVDATVTDCTLSNIEQLSLQCGLEIFTTPSNTGRPERGSDALQ